VSVGYWICAFGGWWQVKPSFSSSLNPLTMSNYAKKLEDQLDRIQPASSDETQQTLAKWIGFNRKKLLPHLSLLQEALRGPKQDAIYGLLHHCLIMEHDTPKWTKLEGLRMALAESVLLPVLPSAALKPRVQESLKMWEDLNALGGPTLLNQIKQRLLKEETESTKASSTDASSKPEEASQTDGEKKEKDKETTEGDTKEQDTQPTESPVQPTFTSFDFEATGIAAAVVTPDQLAQPCHNLAALQITRDVRNDAAVQLSSQLGNMPADVRETCANGDKIDTATARDFAQRIDGSILDMDVTEELDHVSQLRTFITNQQAARQELYQLLVQSRCQFDAHEAAQALSTASVVPLVKRRQILLDAMELEGLDVETEGGIQEDTELPPLTWYANKKARVE